MPRPKTFDRDVALDRAMELFWRRGYEATSIQDLLDRLHLNRGSLYATFGQKDDLFRAALARYHTTVRQEALTMLETTATPLATIRLLFQAVVEQDADDARRGCLIVNTATELAPHDATIAATVAASERAFEAAFERALERARAAGEVSERHDARALARFLVNSLNGLTVAAKALPDPERLQDIVNVTLSVLD